MTTYSASRPARGGSPSITFKQSRARVVGFILVTALLAFEIFNFDTTNYALADLLGDVSFAGLKWSAVLAFAFCAIDFAGLARIFTPEQQLENEPKEVWYLMGAWCLGATMNAVMTWWAVSVTLLSHDLGNEILSRETLLTYVPPFVAVLVWTTRILFIGSLSMAADAWLNADAAASASTRTETAQPQTRPQSRPQQQTQTRRSVPRPAVQNQNRNQNRIVQPSPVTQVRAVPRAQMAVNAPRTMSAQPPPVAAAPRNQGKRPPTRPTMR